MDPVPAQALIGFAEPWIGAGNSESRRGLRFLVGQNQRAVGNAIPRTLWRDGESEMSEVRRGTRSEACAVSKAVSAEAPILQEHGWRRGGVASRSGCTLHKDQTQLVKKGYSVGR